MSVTHSTFSVSLHRSGRSGLSATAAFIVGPRNCGQLSLPAAAGPAARVRQSANAPTTVVCFMTGSGMRGIIGRAA